MKQARFGNESRAGFTLTELLVVIAIIVILIVASAQAYTLALVSARSAVSMSNLRQLANANVSYVADHDGYFCPAQEPKNLIRWHGARTSSSGTFDATKGYLADYLGKEGKVKNCPLFLSMVKGFEDGSGGYGYNEIYIGGTPADNYQPAKMSNVPHLDRTVMFTTTAFAKSAGLQAYPFSEAPQWVDPNNQLSGPLQPSVHFRANGKALVAWCDGHVTAEAPSQLGGSDYYGGNSAKSFIGWFGPLENNGYWNPDYSGP